MRLYKLRFQVQFYTIQCPQHTCKTCQSRHEYLRVFKELIFYHVVKLKLQN